MGAKVRPQHLMQPTRAMDSRRAEYSAATKRALVDVARRLFSDHGYASTSLDEIVAGARVTKGALYHHFSGKQALFEAVFERVEEDAVSRIRKAMRASADPWEQVRAAIAAFFSVARSDEYRHVVLQDGPAVLGYERFREQEERSTMSIVKALVSGILPSSSVPREVTEPFARLFFGALSAAASTVSTADDPERASAELQTVVELLTQGIRREVGGLVEGGGSPDQVRVGS